MISGKAQLKKITVGQFKGRRHVQVCVVKPSKESLSSDDSYLLTTPSQLWIWIGSSSNVIEKARVSTVLVDY